MIEVIDNSIASNDFTVKRNREKIKAIGQLLVDKADTMGELELKTYLQDLASVSSELSFNLGMSTAYQMVKVQLD